MNREMVADERNRSSRRHEVDVERRRAHPGEPRRTLVTDRPPARDDRRGLHARAGHDASQGRSR